MAIILAAADLESIVKGIYLIVLVVLGLGGTVWRHLRGPVRVFLNNQTDRRLVSRLQALEPSWPSGRWELPAPESYLLLHGFSRVSNDPFKLALMQLVATGIFVIEGARILGPKASGGSEPEDSGMSAPFFDLDRRLAELTLGTVPEAVEKRRVGFRDVPLRDVHDRNRVLALLQPGETVEELLHEDQLVLVRSAKGEMGWIQVMELRQPALESPGGRVTVERNAGPPNSAYSARPEAEPDLPGSLRLFYALWRAAAPYGPTVASVAGQAAMNYRSVSRFGTEGAAPLLEQMGLCVRRENKYFFTPEGEETRVSLGQRVAALLRASGRAGPGKPMTARIVLLQALLAVSLGHGTRPSQFVENMPNLPGPDADGGTRPAPMYDDASSWYWFADWERIDQELDSTSRDEGGGGDSGDSGDSGDGGDGGGGD